MADSNYARAHVLLCSLFANVLTLCTGIPELRKAIASFHQRHDKLMDIDESRVIVGPGTKELIFLLMNIFHGGLFNR